MNNIGNSKGSIFTLSIHSRHVSGASNLHKWKDILDRSPKNKALLETLKENKDSNVIPFFKLLISFAQTMFVLSGIPSFDTPIIKSVTFEKDVHKLNFSLHSLSYISTANIKLAFKEVQKNFLVMLTQPFSFSVQEKIYSEIDKNIIKVLGRRNSFGKSTVKILSKADELDIPYTFLGNGIFQLGWGALGKKIHRSSIEEDKAYGPIIARDKKQTANLIKMAGLPAAYHILAQNHLQARQAAQKIGFPLVIKPADLERGEGVSVDVSQHTLQPAFDKAIKLSPSRRVLIERQVKGVCHRFVIINGELLYAVKRLPLGVYGDGKTTIKSLIESQVVAQLKLPIWERNKLNSVDELASMSLAKLKLTVESIPDAKTFIPLRSIETTELGGIDEEVTSIAHNENVRLAETVAQLFGISSCGVDIISNDITKPWSENGAIVNEVNFAPLLGGGEISQNYLEKFLNLVIAGNGRITIQVFVGDQEALHEAKKVQKKMIQNGENAFLTSAVQTLNSNQEEVTLTSVKLFERVIALLLCKEVEALVIVVQSDDIIESGYPVDAINEITVVNKNIKIENNNSIERKQNFVKMMKSWPLISEFKSQKKVFEQ